MLIMCQKCKTTQKIYVFKGKLKKEPPGHTRFGRKCFCYGLGLQSKDWIVSVFQSSPWNKSCCLWVCAKCYRKVLDLLQDFAWRFSKIHIFLGRAFWCGVFVPLPLSHTLPLCVSTTLTVSEAEHRPEPTGQICLHAGLRALCHPEERRVQNRWGCRGAHVPLWPGGVQVHQVRCLKPCCWLRVYLGSSCRRQKKSMSSFCSLNCVPRLLMKHLLWHHKGYIPLSLSRAPQSAIASPMRFWLLPLTPSSLFLSTSKHGMNVSFNSRL